MKHVVVNPGSAYARLVCPPILVKQARKAGFMNLNTNLFV